MLKAILLCFLAFCFVPVSLHAAEVEMTLDTIPTGANVEMGGRHIGTTPLKIKYPSAYFQAPATVFARHLASSLIFTIKKEGFPDKRIELGEGPNSWVSLDGSNRFEYYLLRRSYLIRLDEPESSSSAEDILAAATALEKLAELRDDGVITEEEFAAQKQKLLGDSTEQSHSPLMLGQNTHPVEFCSLFLMQYSDYHRIDLEMTRELIEESNGPIARCLWVQPAAGVASLKIDVQCGIEDPASACTRLDGQADVSGRPLLCLGTREGDTGAVYENGCLAVSAGSGDPMAVESLVAKVLQEFAGPDGR